MNERSQQHQETMTMPGLSAQNLTKQYGRLRAVDGLTFEAPPGVITGFLGPNGAGKTTTLRMLLGLVRPTSGDALVGGRRYADLPNPKRTVGAVLDAASTHPGRSGLDQLRVLAGVAGVGEPRIRDVLDLVGLDGAADRRISGYSLGMRQRLGLAGALLADPEVLILDEPANGLDPEGIAWLRSLLQSIAADGRTVLISSHVLSEVAQTVDRVVIVDRGRLRFAGSLDELASGAVSVQTSDAADLVQLREAIAAAGHSADVTAPDGLEVHGATPAQVGEIAAARGIALAGLGGTGSLEAAFLRLTGGGASRPAERGRGLLGRRTTTQSEAANDDATQTRVA